MKKELEVKWRRCRSVLSSFKNKTQNKTVKLWHTGPRKDSEEGIKASLMQMTPCSEKPWAGLETYRSRVPGPRWTLGHRHETTHVYSSWSDILHHPSMTQWFHSQALQPSLQVQLFTSASQEVLSFLGDTWGQSPIRWKVSNESRRIKHPHLTLLSLVPNCEQDKGGRLSFHLLSFNTRKKEEGRKKKLLRNL